MTAAAKKPNPRKNADDAYEAFMDMPDSEWHGLVMSIVSGGVLEVEENLGFERAMKARPKSQPQNAMITESAYAPVLPQVIHTKELIVARTKGVMDIIVNGVDDKAGLEIAYRKRLELDKIKSSIEKEREAEKRYWLNGGNAVQAAAKEKQELLAPFREHLIAQETAVANEKARLAKIKEDAKREARVSRLLELGWTQELEPYSDDYLIAWSESDFELICARMVTRVADKKLADEARAKQEAEARAEADRMRLQKEELDRREQQQKDEAARLQKIQDYIATQKGKQEQAERDRLAAIERAEAAVIREAARAEQLRLAQEEAAQKARIETEARLKREAEAEAQREAAEVAEIARQAMLRPDKEKLLAIADAIQAITFPEVSAEMSDKVVRINRVMVAASRDIRGIVNEK